MTGPAVTTDTRIPGYGALRQQSLMAPGALMAGTCCECGHAAGCDCDCCPYPLPAVVAAQRAENGGA